MAFGLATGGPTIVRLHDWLSLRAGTHSDHPAVVAGARSATYAELDRETDAAARRLAALGVTAGDRVAAALPAGLELVTLLHAAARVGAALVPLDARLTASERRAQIDETAPRLVVEEPLAGEQADLAPRWGIDLDAPWTILFTSGTTGQAKPVGLSHRNHVASAIASAWGLGVAPDDRWLCVLPLFHVGGLAIPIRSAVYGTTAVVYDGFATATVADTIARGEITLASLVPTMLRRLADAGLERAPALRAILLGGASAPPDLLRWAEEQALPVVRTYGMTETASQVATEPAPGAGARALPGVQLQIGRSGEILVRGPMVASGALDPGGWLRTGDRGRLDGRGLLHVEGRLDDVIVTGGENVSAVEVEEALLAHPNVADAGVVGLPDREWGEAVVAFVVPAPGAAPSPGELIEHGARRLAPFKVPKEVRLVAALPRNAQGKLVRSRLGEEPPSGPPTTAS